MEVMIDAMSREHERLRNLIDIPIRVFNRVEDNLQRLKLQTHSIYHHSLRMEKQTKNIQEQVPIHPISHY